MRTPTREANPASDPFLTAGLASVYLPFPVCFSAPLCPVVLAHCFLRFLSQQHPASYTQNLSGISSMSVFTAAIPNLSHNEHLLVAISFNLLKPFPFQAQLLGLWDFLGNPLAEKQSLSGLVVLVRCGGSHCCFITAIDCLQRQC